MRVIVAVVLVMVLQFAAGRDVRVRRGFNGSGYGRGSDERDASVSQEGLGCSGNISRGNSGSRENFRDRDTGSTERSWGSRSFSRASASASSSARGGHKANLVETLKPRQ